jgi:hypothetical protein
MSASGWTYFTRFVLYDYETESLWFQLDGTMGLTCVSGQYADKRLEEVFWTKTQWNEWKAQNPNTKFMKY